MITAFMLVVTIVYGQRMPWVLTQQGALHHRASELARAAETDPLTGIANRAGFAASGLALLKEPAPARHALMMLGLDHFKPINDQFGHDSGDAVLQRVALRLQRIAGPRDVVARLGGDEFALMLASRSARDELAAFAQRLIREATRPIQLQDQIHQVGASVGITRFPAHGEDLSQLMRCSDLALYQAKHAGRGTFAFFDDLPPSTTSFARL